jgi:hypothetical protein
MIKIISSFCLSLFFYSINAQTSCKAKTQPFIITQCTSNWDSCSAKSLFCLSKIYYKPLLNQVSCNIAWGMAVNKITHQKSSQKKLAPKVIIKFSFKNFASFLVYLDYKNFNLKLMRKTFNQFKATYRHPKNEMLVTQKDYNVFLKKYFSWINKLSGSEKEILKGYITFFEIQYNFCISNKN